MKKFGDTRDDGWVFTGYHRRVAADGTLVLYERWNSPEAWARRAAKRSAVEQRYRANRDKDPARAAKARKYAAEYMAKTRAVKIANRLYSAAKARAAKAGLTFTIGLEDVRIPDVCPVLGIPLRVSSGGHSAGSPSIDRIDPLRGYEPDNIAVISHRANALKRDATPEELELLAAYVRLRHKR